MYYYSLFNRVFSSDFKLPLDLCLISEPKSDIFGHIYYCGKTRKHESGLPLIQIGKSLYKENNLYIIDKVACKFIIDPFPRNIMVYGSEECISAITLYLLGEVLAFLFRLYGIFQLHGAVVYNGTHSIAMCGHSGNGKTTLSKEFSLRGWNILTDDHTIVYKNNNSKDVYVSPSFPYIKSFYEGEYLNSPNLIFDIPATNKGFFCIDSFENRDMYLHDYKLSAIFFLRLVDNRKKEISLTKLDSFSSLQNLISNTYSNLKSNGDVTLLKKDLEFLQLLKVISNTISHYELVFGNGTTPEMVVDYMINKMYVYQS